MECGYLGKERRPKNPQIQKKNLSPKVAFYVRFIQAIVNAPVLIDYPFWIFTVIFISRIVHIKGKIYGIVFENKVSYLASVVGFV